MRRVDGRRRSNVMPCNMHVSASWWTGMKLHYRSMAEKTYFSSEDVAKGLVGDPSASCILFNHTGKILTFLFPDDCGRRQVWHSFDSTPHNLVQWLIDSCFIFNAFEQLINLTNQLSESLIDILHWCWLCVVSTASATTTAGTTDRTFLEGWIT